MLRGIAWLICRFAASRMSKELLLTPVTICRNEDEKVLIKPSVNSVRMSILIKQADEIEVILAKKFTVSQLAAKIPTVPELCVLLQAFLMQRAEHFIIMRRKPVEGYSISFLITHTHLEKYWKDKLIDFVITFMMDIDKEIKDMKLKVNTRARLVATAFLKALS